MGKKHFKKWGSLGLSALLLGGSFLPNLAGHAKAQFGSVIISEVYGGGGNSGAIYKNDFIELYNPTDTAISIEGWSVQYASAAGTSYQLTKLTGSIKAHGYYLVQEAPGSGNAAALPKPDVSGSINMSGTAGKVALSNKNTALIGGIADGSVVDFVGFGSTASEKEGNGTAPAPSNTTSVERRANDSSDPTGEGAGKGNGWDTNDNTNDFVVAAPNPQNSSSALEPELTNPGTPSDGVTFLKDVRDSDLTTGQSKLLGQTVTVEGTATVSNNVVGAKSFYIQDATGGVNIFGSTQDVKAGDKVKVTGQVVQYNGLTEISPTSIEVTGKGSEISPTVVNKLAVFGNFNTAEPLEGTLVQIRAKATDVPVTSTGNVTLTDDAGKTILVRVSSGTGIDLTSTFKKDSYYTVTGIVGQYDSSNPYTTGYQVYPRSISDVNEYFVLSLAHDPITKAYRGTDVQFTANASGADSVTVYYKGNNASDYTALPMAIDSNGVYKAILPAASLPLEGFSYYIEAKNPSDVKTAGTAGAPYAVSVENDVEGPAITGVQPVNNSIVETTTPDISFQISDPSGIDSSKLSVKVDGQEMASSVKVVDGQATLELTNPLSVGTHSVAVGAADNKGNSSNATWSFSVAQPFTGGNHYRGTTHNHTNISHDGAGTPEDALKAGQAHGYDWFAFSDHSHDIDSTLADKDTVDHNGMPERKGGDNWQLTKDLAQKYTKNGDYVVFPAFEMTSTTWGHSNVFGTDNFIDRKMNSGKYQDLNQYYAWVLTYDNIAAQFNHPDMSANAFNNFMPYDQRVDKLFTMLEVGNGSGNYAYANAEKKFYSALDLGWHIAPTYGEDNHDGTWGQTLNRTVIVSEDLSQASLLHSMENMRVYMEEDPNFKLDVLANGQYMGSVVDSKSLTFDINGSDSVAESKSMPGFEYLPSSYKSDDTIEKVELITNGSKVVDTLTPNSKNFTWNPQVTVTGGQQWFVVKVTQKDGERIYSSPIWTKEQPVDVRVSGLEVAGDAIISGNPATLEAGVSNLGKTALSNLNVKFYYDQVNENNLIGQSPIAQIAAKGVAKASVVWNNPVAGQHQLLAVVDTPTGDNPEDNTFSKDINIKQALGIKVMIDAAHKNENTSTDPGTYKNNFNSFTSLVQREGYTVFENKNPLTTESLKDVKVLVLTHPQIDLTEDENKAVAEFVKNGGSLFLTDKSNFNNDTDINNDLLFDIGSSIRINNDGINDDTKEGNFWSDPLKSKFAVRLHLHPVANYITDRADTIEYYSGSSLEKAGHEALTDSDTVTILASGNETTYQGSVKSGYTPYDTVSDATGGSAIPAIASETIGKGRIVVSGMNFMNDKQLDESFSPKGNDEAALNAVNWLAGRGTVVSDLSEARIGTDGQPVVVEGTVTTGAGTFYDAFYLQDETGGIMAFHDVPEGSLKPGDKVRVYGQLKTFENNRELEYTDFAKDVIKLGHVDPLQPQEVTTGAANNDENQGLLVKVTGKVVSKYDENSYVINDGSGDILVFTDGYIATQTGSAPDLKVGQTLQAVGLTGKYAKGNRIRVRDTKELVRIVDEAAPVTEIQVDPAEANGSDEWYNSDVSFSLSATDNQSGVQSTQYRINGGDWTDYTSPVELTSDGTYNIEYRSTDVEENAEAVKSYEVKIDKTAPVTVQKLNPEAPTGNNGWYNSNVTFSLNASDETSDIQTTLYSINGQGWQEYKNPIELTTDGEYTIEYKSFDNAGNTENSNSFVVKIDKTAPTLKVSVDKPVLQVPNHKMIDIRASLVSDDNLSGVDSVILESIKVNEASAAPSDIQGAEYGTNDVNFSLRSERNGTGNGRVYTITYLVTDKAGNTYKASATVTVPRGLGN